MFCNVMPDGGWGVYRSGQISIYNIISIYIYKRAWVLVVPTIQNKIVIQLPSNSSDGCGQGVHMYESRPVYPGLTTYSVLKHKY